MRHEKITPQADVDVHAVPARWSSSDGAARLAFPDVESFSADTLQADCSAVPGVIDAARCPSAAADVPAAAGKLIAGAYVALLVAVALATTGSLKSLLAVTIAGFFVFMFFAVPAVFFGVEGENRNRVSLNRFLDDGLVTYTGHCGGAAALVQMLIVPVLLTFGAILMGIAAAIIF